MELTTPQLQTIKTAINADPTLENQPYDGDGLNNIADALNAPASPTFIIWKTSVDPDEIMKNGMDWTRVDNLTAGRARIWDWMTRLGTFDASKANVRAGIDACWVGTAADLAVRAQVYIHCKRAASRLEKILSTGTGTDAVPATMTFEGAISRDDVDRARRS